MVLIPSLATSNSSGLRIRIDVWTSLRVYSDVAGATLEPRDKWEPSATYFPFPRRPGTTLLGSSQG
jgi:hypothetical protein